jgi:hypothetical protein
MFHQSFGPVFAALLFSISFSATPSRADVIMDWNGAADAIATEKQIPPVPHGRALSMLHVAMFEAVNAIDRRYTPYKLTLTADRETSREAAASAAAYDILLALYPDQKSTLDAALTAALAGIVDPNAKAKGIDLGKKAAAGVLSLRENDGSAAQETYRPTTSPGVYVSTVLPVFSTAGATKPWAMTSSSQFRPAAPPSLTSETWTKDLNEIREIGARNSRTRTEEQTAIGRFWFLTGARTYNPIVKQVAQIKKMDLVDCARLFALTSIAGNDALVAVFDAKFHYNLWRPLTAIRNADMTNNPETPREASWLPLGDTPLHPEYPCAHCITSAAISGVLQAVAGEDVGEITLTSPTAPGVIRKWNKLQDYSDEVANARIYAGFHYRFSTIVGKEMGKKIAELTIATQMRGIEATAEPKQ